MSEAKMLRSACTKNNSKGENSGSDYTVLC